MSTKRQVKLSFLDSWTPELAWFVGLIYGDGNVYRTPHDARVTLVCNVDTVNKWKALICPDAKHQVKSDDCWAVYIDCRPLVEWFADKGIVGEKSTNLAWPNYLPRNLIQHFIRGLIDTDGSIGIERRKIGNDTLHVSFTAKNQQFAERINEEIRLATGITRVKTCKNSKLVNGGECTWYDFKFNGAFAVKVCEWLYKDTPAEIRGESRYQNYKAYLDEVSKRICACNKPAWSDDKCQACWWKSWSAERPKGMCSGSCGREAYSKGMCLACYKRGKRKADSTYGGKPNGTCGCGRPCFRKSMCHACYSKNRRSAI